MYIHLHSYTTLSSFKCMGTTAARLEYFCVHCSCKRIRRTNVLHSTWRESRNATTYFYKNHIYFCLIALDYSGCSFLGICENCEMGILSFRQFNLIKPVESESLLNYSRCSSSSFVWVFASRTTFRFSFWFNKQKSKFGICSFMNPEST